MKQSNYSRSIVLTLLCIFFLAATVSTQTKEKAILIGSGLTEGFDMGVDTSNHLTKWLNKESDAFRMDFPSDQKWAAVFITYGEPVDPPRPPIDLSAYKTLQIEMRGSLGGEKVEIGIKTNTQPDDGKEKKFTITLTPKWDVYTFQLDKFTDVDTKNLYVVTEFVYKGAKAQTVYFKNIKYLAK